MLLFMAKETLQLGLRWEFWDVKIIQVFSCNHKRPYKRQKGEQRENKGDVKMEAEIEVI